MAEAAMRALRRRMDAEEEARVAELITSNLEAVSRRAQEKGYLAYAQPPSPERQARLNERFLLSTIRGVNYSNRKADVEEMWELRRLQQEREGQERVGPWPAPRGRGPAGGGLFARELGLVQRQAGGRGEQGPARQQQQQQEQQRKRRRTDEGPAGPPSASASLTGDSDGGATSSGEGGGREAASQGRSGEGTPQGGMSDEELALLLAQRRVRGRGAVGTRVDEPGPFLPPDAASEYPEEPLAPLFGAPQQGPQRPAWLAQGEALSQREMLTGAGPQRESLPLPAEGSAGGMDTGRGSKAVKVKKEKKSKKHKKERHRKDKKRRTREPAGD